LPQPTARAVGAGCSPSSSGASLSKSLISSASLALPPLLPLERGRRGAAEKGLRRVDAAGHRPLPEHARQPCQPWRTAFRWTAKVSVIASERCPSCRRKAVRYPFELRDAWAPCVRPRKAGKLGPFAGSNPTIGADMTSESNKIRARGSGRRLTSAREFSRAPRLHLAAQGEIP
jgi:hypothetical protein